MGDFYYIYFIGGVMGVMGLVMWWRWGFLRPVEPYGERLSAALAGAGMDMRGLRALVGRRAVSLLSAGRAQELSVRTLMELGDLLRWDWLDVLRLFSAVEVESVAAYERECQRLEAKIGQRDQELERGFRVKVVQRLANLVCQYPTIAYAVERKKDISATVVLRLLDCLTKLLDDLGVRVIGRVGEVTAFDPDLHEPYGDETPVAGDPVYIRYVGLEGDGVLHRARVSRELPY